VPRVGRAATGFGPNGYERRRREYRRCHRSQNAHNSQANSFQAGFDSDTVICTSTVPFSILTG
jgi:hypothetical protein